MQSFEFSTLGEVGGLIVFSEITFIEDVFRCHFANVFETEEIDFITPTLQRTIQAQVVFL